MIKKSNKDEHSFLNVECELGKLIQKKDWSLTSLGSIDNWSQNLKTTINIMLNSKSPMFLFWGKDHICFYNDAFRPSLGKNGKHPNSLGEPASEFWSEIWDQIQPNILSVLNSGKATWNNNQMFRIERNGKLEETFWTYGYSAVQDENGFNKGVLTITTETTISYKAILKLEESEERFRRIAEGNSMMIAMADKSKKGIYFNQAWSDFSGKTSEELMDFGWTELIHPDQRNQAILDYQSHLDKNEIWEDELRLKDKFGRYRWIGVYIMPRFADDGTFDSAVSSSVDIHKRKTFSDELEKEVKIRTEELKQSNIELEKSNEELQAFNYISSHDLQEPLRKIQMFASQILRSESENLSDKGKSKLIRLDASANRMQKLIKDLLEYSRLDSMDLKFTEVQFEEILNEVETDLYEELLEVNAKLELVSSKKITVIPFQIKQLISNLITNSLKFRNLEIQTVITISVEEVSSSAVDIITDLDTEKFSRIEVKDNGIGFNQLHADKIFEVFQRLHTREQFEGTGIGLSIVKKIVENHNGVIKAESELGKGAKFTIWLPILENY